MNVNTQRIVVQTGLIGELPEYSAVGTLDGNVLTFALPTGTEPTDNIFGKFVLSYPTGTEPADTTEIQLSYGQQIIRLVTPYNRENGNATLSMLKQTNVAWNATDGLKIGFTGLVQRTDTDEISVEVNEDNLSDYATKFTKQSITLLSGGWSSNTQTVNVQGVTETNLVIVSPNGNPADYASAGIYCSAQGSGTLTFTCTTVPTSDIVVNIVVEG